MKLKQQKLQKLGDVMKNILAIIFLVLSSTVYAHKAYIVIDMPMKDGVFTLSEYQKFDKEQDSSYSKMNENTFDTALGVDQLKKNILSSYKSALKWAQGDIVYIFVTQNVKQYWPTYNNWTDLHISLINPSSLSVFLSEISQAKEVFISQEKNTICLGKTDRAIVYEKGEDVEIINRSCIVTLFSDILVKEMVSNFGGQDYFNMDDVTPYVKATLSSLEDVPKEEAEVLSRIESLVDEVRVIFIVPKSQLYKAFILSRY